MASIPLGQYRRDTPPQGVSVRQPTLESQHGSLQATPNIWARLFSRRPRALDNFERLLTEQTTNARDRKELLRFSRDYRWLKLRDGTQISRCLVWYKSFGPFAPYTLDAWLELGTLQFADSQTFSLCLEQLGKALESNPPNHLQLCVIAALPDEKVLARTFSFSVKLFASAGRRLDRLNDIARHSIAVVVAHAWNLSDQVSRLLTPERGSPRQFWGLKLPSLRPSDDPLDLSNPGEKYISLTWQYEAPKYVGDFNIYIWRQYQKAPSYQYADIFLLSSTKLIISLKSSQMLHHFTSLRLDASILGLPSGPRQPWSTISELFLSVLTVYEQMIKETGVFVQESMHEITKMKIKGRQAPSASKIRYLVHLEDCRLLAVQGINQGLSSLARISVAVNAFPDLPQIWDAGIPFPERIGSIKKDLVYLKQELKFVGQPIEELTEMIRGDLNLIQGQRLFVLTIAAALFIPLSFLSSFFGMNIANSTPQDFSGLSQLTNYSLAGLSNVTYNQTAAVLTSLGASGNRTWDLKYYWIFAVPFLFTIPLFLAAGRILRWCIQSAAKYAVYWRIVAFFIAPIIYFGLCWVLPKFVTGRRASDLMSAIISVLSFATCALIFLRLVKGRRFQEKEKWAIFLPFYLLLAASILDAFIWRFIHALVFILLPWFFVLGMWVARIRSS